MNLKQTLITALSALFILILFNIGPYKAWIDKYVMSFTDDIYDQADNMGIEYRCIQRYGDTYTVIQNLKQQLLKIEPSIDKINLLIPPQSYIDKLGINFILPEPVVLYNFTQIKAALPTSKDVYKSNYGIRITSTRLIIVKIASKAGIDSLLSDYKNPVINPAS